MYYDLLTRIKNAERARKESFQMPFSSFDLAVAKILVDAGYVKDAEKRTLGKRAVLEVKLKYRNREGVLENFRLMSTPGRHVYRSYRELKPVRQGYGLAVVSTSSGVLSHKDARKRKLGGEYLFEVW